MTYEIGKMKLDELAGYFRDGKINLIPPFQRGRPWPLALRKKLLENIIRRKPIPAIFLYKEESGTKYSYNILDGKQRLESLLLFIGDSRADLSIPNWRQYFVRSPHSKNAHFKVNVANDDEPPKNRTFAQLEQELIRDFREYSIPTIEIDMDKEEGGLKEIIDLFIDINQRGVKVTRFDIIRTMMSGEDANKFVIGIFKLVAIRQKRAKDYFYKMVDSDFTAVLKYLQSVQGLMGRDEHQARVDRVWERLLEIALFIRTKQHRTLAQILKAFLGRDENSTPIKPDELTALRKLFKFLRSVYTQTGFRQSRLAKDQPHFYTMATSIYSLDLVEKHGEDVLKKKLAVLSHAIGTGKAPHGLNRKLEEYMALSSKQTTHPGRRARRQELFADLIDSM